MKNISLQPLLLGVVVHVALTITPQILLGGGYSLGSLPWQIVASTLIVSLLSYIVLHAHWTGKKLVALLVLLQFGVANFNTMIEALFFELDIPKQEALFSVATALLVAVIFSPVLVRFLGRNAETGAANPTSKPRTPLAWAGKGALVAFLYFALYFVAGMLVYPFVKDFYADKHLPGIGEMLAMQLFRGTVYLLVCLPVIRTMTTSRMNIGLTVGAALSILGGIAPLLLPNPYMPDYIRPPHMIEVGVSNFVFGFLMVRLVKQ